MPTSLASVAPTPEANVSDPIAESASNPLVAPLNSVDNENALDNRTKHGRSVQGDHQDRLLVPVFIPRVLDPDDTLARRMCMAPWIDAFCSAHGVEFVIMASVFCAIAGLYIFSEDYKIGFLVGQGIWLIVVPLLGCRTKIIQLLFTSFLPCYMLMTQTLVVVLVFLLYTGVYVGLSTAMISVETTSCVLWDALPAKLRRKVFPALLAVSFVCTGGSIKISLDFNRTIADESSSSMAIRASGAALTFSVYTFHLFWATYRRPLEMAAVTSRMQTLKVSRHDFQELRSQVTRIKIRASTVDPPNKVEISPGIDELVDVLYSPVPPRVINTRQTIGAMVLGKTFCNGIFLLHKRIPGYNIIGTVLTLAMYACLGHAFWAFEEPRQEIIVALGCLGGWFLVTTLPLTNHCLLKLILTTFEGRLVLTVQCLSCSIMLYMFPRKATVVIFVISMQLFQGLISDAWPSFITGYRLRAVGHGTNSAMLGAIFYCIQNEAFLGGMHSSRNLEIYLPLGIVVKLKAVLLSAITINLAFTLKWFCLALIGTRLCLILRAPIVLTQMPRSEFQKYERLCYLNLSLGPKGSEPLSKPPPPLHSSPREAGRASVAH